MSRFFSLGVYSIENGSKNEDGGVAAFENIHIHLQRLSAAETNECLCSNLLIIDSVHLCMATILFLN